MSTELPAHSSATDQEAETSALADAANSSDDMEEAQGKHGVQVDEAGGSDIEAGNGKADETEYYYIEKVNNGMQDDDNGTVASIARDVRRSPPQSVSNASPCSTPEQEEAGLNMKDMPGSPHPHRDDTESESQQILDDMQSGPDPIAMVSRDSPNWDSMHGVEVPVLRPSGAGNNHSAKLPVPKPPLGMKVLWSEETGRSDRKPVIDVVAVHGLGGHREETWKHTSSTNGTESHSWLEDPKPHGPDWGRNTRIMAHGYTTTEKSRIFTLAEDLLNDLSDRRVGEQARRKSIVFIGHCLGGLIIKAALVHAHFCRPQFNSIIDSTKAIIFFATPHQGSSRQDWLRYTRALERVDSKAHVLEELSTWSNELIAKTATFSYIAAGLDITSFYGTKGEQVVPEASARIGLPNERTASIHADHQEMCQFELEGDNYHRVSQRLKAVLHAIGAQDQETNKRQCIASWRVLNGTQSGAGRMTLGSVTWNWITDQQAFQQWKSESSGIFIVSGELGYTQELLTQHAPDHLEIEKKTETIFSAWSSSKQQTEANLIQYLLSLAAAEDEGLVDELDAVAAHQHLAIKGSSTAVRWPLELLRKYLTALLFVDWIKPIRLFIDARNEAGESQIEDMITLFLQLTRLGNKFKCKIFVTCRRPITISPGHYSHIGHVSLDSQIDGVGKSIYEWVLFAKRPLTVAELGEALGGEDDNGPANLQEIFRTSCHGLIDTKDGTVHLHHELPKGCLLRLIRNQFYQGLSLELEESSHSTIARRCLEYLKSMQDHQVPRSPFWKYAAQYWSDHMNEAPHGLQELARKIDKDERGRTPLFVAVQKQHEATVRALLQQNCPDINTKDEDGFTPLSIAAKLGNERICSLLCPRAGANKKSNGLKPVYIAAQEGHADIARLLLSYTTDGPANGIDPTFLHLAAREGSLHAAKLFLQESPGDTEVTDHDGRTPLFLAIQEDRGPVVSLLREKLESGKINKPGPESKRTLLTLALEQGSPSAVQWLLDWGADLNQADGTGKAPLHVAVGGVIDDVELLIDYGASVNQPDLVSKETPLHVAVNRGETAVNIVELLLDSQADITARDNNGDTPVHAAASNMSARTVQILLDRNPRVLNARNKLGESPLHRGASTDAVDVVEVLLQKGARIDAKNNSGHAPLHVAAARNNPQVARILIMYGASLELRDRAGRTPLQVASANGNHVLTKILIGVGVNKAAKDYGNLTARDIAEMRKDGATVAEFHRAHTPEESQHDFDWQLQACTQLKAASFFTKWNQEAIDRCKGVADTVKIVVEEYRVKPEHIPGLFMLTQYTIVLLCDNSRSMGKENRKELLQDTLIEVAEIARKLTKRGVFVRFLNPVDKQWEDPPALSVEDIRTKIRNVGIDLQPGTKLGTRLEELIIRPMHCSHDYEKPIITIIITDGEEDRRHFQAINTDCKIMQPFRKDSSPLQAKILAYKERPERDRKSVFLISQIGSDDKATEFLKEVEQDDRIKDIVLCSPEKLDQLHDDTERKYGTNLMELFSAAVAKRR